MTRDLADTAAVLFANEAFYLAFRTQDISAMDAMWSSRTPVVCIHPGWQALRSREEVMASWEGILGAEQSPDIAIHSARAVVTGDCAIVVCYERVEEADLAATNVFIREIEGWKLVHHQAGICQDSPQPENPDDESPVFQ